MATFGIDGRRFQALAWWLLIATELGLAAGVIAGSETAAWLAAACSKGGRHGRVYRIPRRVAAAVAAYTDPVEGSRAEVVGTPALTADGRGHPRFSLEAVEDLAASRAARAELDLVAHQTLCYPF